MIIAEDKICVYPFQYFEVYNNGNVYPCCQAYCKNYSFGNLNEDKSFLEIWNSKKAIEFRKKILENDYSCCNLNVCPHVISAKNKSLVKDKLKLENYPTILKMVWDRECNVACTMCRNKIYRNTEEELKKFELYENKILPIVDKLDEVIVSGGGDPFGSRYCREFIKKVVDINPKIKVSIHSNGVLFTEKLSKELGIIDKISHVSLSIHAATEKTYNKVVKYSNFKLLKKNIEWLSQMKKEGKIKSLHFIFVVNNNNYIEMVDFVKMAKKYGASVYFSLCRDWGADYTKDFSKIQVWNRKHPKHHEFLKIINNPIFKDEKVHKEQNIKNLYNTEPYEQVKFYSKLNKTIKIFLGKYNF